MMLNGRDELKDWLARHSLFVESPGDILPYQVDDLWRLYEHIRMTACVSVLEFGSGWSTLVLALALAENRDSFIPVLHHPSPFELHTVDADPEWQKIALERLPPELLDHVYPMTADVVPVVIDGRSCHVFAELPDLEPDLIYLDAPDPDQLTGRVVGSRCPDRWGLPMSGDVLQIEPHLWPGTTVIVDGRTANARFLATNLRRNWQTWEDPFGDRSWLQLVEAPFGPQFDHEHPPKGHPVSRRHLELRGVQARRMRRGRNGRWGEPK